MTSIADYLHTIAFSVLAYLSIIGIIYYVYYELILAARDEKAFTKNLFTNVFMIIIPVIIVFVLISFLSFEPTTAAYFIFGSLFLAVIFGVSGYFLQTSLSEYIFNRYLLYIVIAAIMLIGVSIVITLLSGTLKKLTGWTGFFINSLFYIPCLIRDMVQGGIQEYNTFSATLMVLFVVEVILLMTYFFLMPFVNNQIFPESVNLVNEVVMLNTEHPIKVPSDISNNFALSMWTYINPGSINKPGYSVESPIFSFMDASGKRHIQLTYSNVESNNDFIMYVGEYEFPISQPLQKWNHFVFNYSTYDEYKTPINIPKKKWYEWWYTPQVTPPKIKDTVKKTTVDMFINGHLERSFTYEENDIPVFSSTLDKMFIGNTGLATSSVVMGENGVEGTDGKNSNNSGLYGAICNVNYYKKPLTKMAIIYHYNTNIINNPPV